MATLTDLQNMFRYYNGLPHQNKAISSIYDSLTNSELEEALQIYRKDGKTEETPKILDWNDPNRYLSKNFQLWEFLISQTAERHGIKNTPSQTNVKNLERLTLSIIQPARDALGPIKISSGFRIHELNVRVGGSSTSDHVLGYAADLQAYQVSNLTLAKWIKNNCKGKYDQIILEYGTDSNPAWIHVSNNPRLRGQVLRKRQGQGYIPYQI